MKTIFYPFQRRRKAEKRNWNEAMSLYERLFKWRLWSHRWCGEQFTQRLVEYICFSSSTELSPVLSVFVCVLWMLALRLFALPVGFIYFLYDECKLKSVRCMFVIMCPLLVSLIQPPNECVPWSYMTVSKYTFPCLNRLTRARRQYRKKE